TTHVVTISCSWDRMLPDPLETMVDTHYFTKVRSPVNGEFVQFPFRDSLACQPGHRASWKLPVNLCQHTLKSCHTLNSIVKFLLKQFARIFYRPCSSFA